MQLTCSESISPCNDYSFDKFLISEVSKSLFELQNEMEN
jgi:hypothetical protein